MKKYLEVEITNLGDLTGRPEGVYFDPENNILAACTYEGAIPLCIYSVDVPPLDKLPAVELKPGELKLGETPKPKPDTITEKTLLKAIAIAQSPSLAPKLLEEKD